jgi:formylglycine-generating enzyme required for sulfatase activity
MNDEDAISDTNGKKAESLAELNPRNNQIFMDSVGFQQTIIRHQNNDVDHSVLSNSVLSDRYEIQRRLGRGGMGEVLLATDKLLGREVAIKRLLVRGNADQATVDRFLNEAKSVASLNHQNIVLVYDYGFDNSGPFIVMEFVAGGSLADRLSKGPVPPQEAAMLISNLCDGLHKAHSARLVHRDIKPANILLTSDAMPKLSDFGLVRIASTDNSMTIEGAILGTPDYMAPEQRKDATKADARSDLWSLAATLYQMITGRSPRVMLLDDLPQSMRSFLVRALDASPDRRFQNVIEFKSNLHNCIPHIGATKSSLAGVCPKCRTINEGSRKFCKDCAKSLRYKCIQCRAEVPVWDDVCGDCGCVQPEAIETVLEEIAERKQKAEEMLSQYAFDEANTIGQEIAKTDHPLLVSEAQWAIDFCTHVNELRILLEQQIDAVLVTAKEREASGNFKGAIAAIDDIPFQLFGRLVAGDNISIREYRTQLSNKRNRSRELESAIEKEQGSQSLYPMLELVSEFASLRPDRRDVQEAKGLLVARRAELELVNKRNLEIAKTHAQHFEFELAFEAASKIDPRLVTEPENETRKQIIQTAKEAVELKVSILESIESKKYDSLLDRVERYLSIKPHDAKFISFRTQLLERDQKRRSHADACLLSGRQLSSGGKFSDAARTLATVSMNYRNPAIESLLTKCTELENLKTDVLRSIESFVASHKYSEALRDGDAYLDRLKSDGFRDVEMERELLGVREKQALRKKRIGFVTAFLVLTLLGVLGFVYVAYGSLQRLAEEAKVQDEKDMINRQADEERERQRLEEARIANLSPRDRIIESPPISSLFGIQLKLVPEGHFLMGSSATEKFRDKDELQHEVTISEPFYLGVTEVTQSQYESVLGVNPAAKRKASNADSPVYNVSWYMAAQFCNRLSEMENLQPAYIFAGVETDTEHLHDGTNHEFIQYATVFFDIDSNGYRLPTEAEWEYACRADTTSSYFFGENADQVGEFARLDSSYSRDGILGVGSKKPNPWGLFDLYGSVAELCHDEKRSYTSQSVVDPGLEGYAPSVLVLRGGSIRSAPKDCRSAFRSNVGPRERSEIIGFRVAKILETPNKEAVRQQRELDRTRLMKREAEKNTIGISMKTLSPGRFVMGDGSNRRSYPFRLVRLTKPFSLSTNEVTQDQFEQVLGFNPSSRTGKSLPVTEASWYDAVEFCNRLSELEGLVPVYELTDIVRRKRRNSTNPQQQAIYSAKVFYNTDADGYRLPTSAEWEYACRAGSSTLYCFGDDPNQLPDFAWTFSQANDSQKAEFIHEVGLKKPNAWGFFDMHGNASEWCWDYFWENQPSYSILEKFSAIDPVGPPSDFDTTRLHTMIVRGSGNNSRSSSSFQKGLGPDSQEADVGFRVARKAK